MQTKVHTCILFSSFTLFHLPLATMQHLATTYLAALEVGCGSRGGGKDREPWAPGLSHTAGAGAGAPSCPSALSCPSPCCVTCATWALGSLCKQDGRLRAHPDCSVLHERLCAHPCGCDHPLLCVLCQALHLHVHVALAQQHARASTCLQEMQRKGVGWSWMLA